MVIGLAWLRTPGLVRDLQFRRHELTRQHLMGAKYRSRLEAMSPDEVQRYSARACDSAVADYLARLRVFTREQAALAAAPQGERASVTFIMGEDRNPENRFYVAATDYFLSRDSARTEYVERSLRTLVEVRDFLDNHRPGNGLPWGLVNVVVHSYEWGGMAVPISTGEGRTDVTALRQAMAAGEMKPLPDSVVDCRTEIRIHGCALGRDSLMLSLLSTAFGDTDLQRPRVSSSRYFVFYESRHDPGRPVSADRFFTEYWYATYPKGQRPGNNELVLRLRERYPQTVTDWPGALSRKQPRWTGDCYSHRYELPVRWAVVYPDTQARPRLTGTREKRAWLEGQTDFTSYLARFGLELDDFLWSVREATVSESDSLRPALEAVGRAAIVCVQRELTWPDFLRPGRRERVHVSPGSTLLMAAEVPAREPARPPGQNVPFADR